MVEFIQDSLFTVLAILEEINSVQMSFTPLLLSVIVLSERVFILFFNFVMSAFSHCNIFRGFCMLIFGFISISAIIASWSLRPGITSILFKVFGLFVGNKSKIHPPVIGFEYNWEKERNLL